MSVSIKLSRYGAKKNPFYRIVAATTKSKRDGKNLEVLGNYNPKFKKLEVDQKAVDVWVKKGAILTEGIKRILNKK
jgi:small subunit ribosomal protein S16